MTKLIKDARRTVLINVEQGSWEDHHKVWPHLGLLYVGTVAEREGYEVVLWDEFIQGYAPLERLILPGDIVGLSLVATGIERGVTIAHQVKALGARCVIAGNDASMFRARQLLQLPGAALDAVFTSNSLVSVREFYRQIPTIDARSMRISHVSVDAMRTPFISNETRDAKVTSSEFGPNDFFTVPNLGLYGPEYWDGVWTTYRAQFGHKHRAPEQVKNALGLLAQGCGRAGAGDICTYCTIGHVADVLVPETGYLETTLDAYQKFGVNTFFNVTDSSFEMGKLARQLKGIGANLDTFVLYGRAQAISQRPEMLDQWLDVVNERLLINCGMDSGDESILQNGIHKAAGRTGLRLEENRAAIERIRAAGPTAHLHFSLIFGSPGESVESCERTLEFLQWSIDTLGSQLDVVEGDLWWLNFGAPCAAVFHSYSAAEKLAAQAGKTISREDWHMHFASHGEALVPPWSCEEAWYRYFTNISVDEAKAYNQRVKTMMDAVPGKIEGRTGNFMPVPA